MCEPGAATAAQEDPLPTLTNLRPSVPIYKLPSAEVHRVKRGSTAEPALTVAAARRSSVFHQILNPEAIDFFPCLTRQAPASTTGCRVDGR